MDHLHIYRYTCTMYLFIFVKVPGRLYPIQLEYVPSRKDEFRSKNDRLDPSPYLRIMQTIDTKV